MSDKSIKLSFRISADIAQQIDHYAALSGLNRSAFIGIAVVIGMRSLARQIAPESMMTPELIKVMSAAGFGLPEQEADFPKELVK